MLFVVLFGLQEKCPPSYMKLVLLPLENKRWQHHRSQREKLSEIVYAGKMQFYKCNTYRAATIED